MVQSRNYDQNRKNRDAEIDTRPQAEGLSSTSYNKLYENGDYNPIGIIKEKEEKKISDEYDLQQELEEKFDKLFGNTSNNNYD